MPEPDPARARFFLIAIHRVVGGVLVMLGLLALNDRIDWGDTVGGVLVAVGLLDFAVVPVLLARLWRSPRE